MEQTAFEALMTGVNAFVFIIALTAAVLLMGNIMNMVNYANENAVVGFNGSLAESVGVVEEREYFGKDLLTYYRKEDKKIYSIKKDINSEEQSLEQFLSKEIIDNYINKKFVLDYKGNIDGVDYYLFVGK